MSSSASFYIYYRVPAQNSQPIRAAVNDLQRALMAKTGVAGQLLCRHDDPRTWMEIYENVPDADAFLSVLGGELERLRFDELLGRGSSRQTEIFRPL